MDPVQVQAMFTELLSRVETLFTVDVIVQLAAFAAAIFLARATKRYPQRLIDRAQARVAERPTIEELPGVSTLFPLLRHLILPFGAWLLGRVATSAVAAAGLDTALLEWLVPFLLIWLGYRFVRRLLTLRLPPERAAQLHRQLVRPMIMLVALLHALGLLDDVWSAGIQLRTARFTLGAVVTALLILYLFIRLAGTSRELLGDSVLPRSGMDPALVQVMATFVAYAVILLGFATALGIVGIDLSTVTIILGGLSVGLGFGLQEVISNFVSGFILLIERSIGPTDVVEVEETVGEVATIGIRSTRIRTLDNVELIVPNSRFLTDIVTNYTRGDKRVRVRVAVGVSYDASPREVEAALLEAARDLEVLDEPTPSVLFADFGASSLDFELFVWTDRAHEIPRLKSELRYRIWARLSEKGIEIPFPQRDIHVRTVSGTGRVQTLGDITRPST